MLYLRMVSVPVAIMGLLLGLTFTTQAEEADPGSAAVDETASTPEYRLIWTGPRTLDSLIDERRDALRDRRMARSDAVRRAFGLFDPVMEHQIDMHRAFSDQMREFHRVHRDAMRFHRDAYLSTFMPRAKVHQEIADTRRQAFALESLERQEAMDDLMFAYEPVFGFPFLW